MSNQAPKPHPHPATYTDSFLPIFASLLKRRKTVLDPFGGTGKLALVKEHGFKGQIVCNELEAEWAHTSPYPVDQWIIGDAQHVPLPGKSMSAVCTSPAYGNRMADHHNARDTSRRITYKHYLGRDLDQNNAGRMQWGEQYRTLHRNVWLEMRRLLKPNGLLICNISDHIRGGERQYVTDWHAETLTEMGFTLVDHIKINTPRMKFGANANTRIEYESILVFKN